MPRPPTRNSWAFPPSTTRLQLDEKWSFVAKKEKHCDWQADEDDMLKGDQWDFVALDPDSRLVLSAFVGKRLPENAVLLLEDVKQRLGGRAPAQITSDEWFGYPDAITQVFARDLAEGLSYATVHKTREKGRVVSVTTRQVLGDPAGAVSTSYLERQNGTDRHRNARKGRKTYRFSKAYQAHEAVTYFTLYSYNFCWPVRTLRQRVGERTYRRRTPAMVAGLADHVWSLQEWITFPACQYS